MKGRNQSLKKWLANEDSVWEQLLNTETKQYDGMIHLGDQIYADKLFKETNAEISFSEALDVFRGYYRAQWESG